MGVISLVNWSIFVQRILESVKVNVGDVLDLKPLDGEGASPFTSLVPELLLLSGVDRSSHLCSSAEMFGLINAEEQIDVALLARLFAI